MNDTETTWPISAAPQLRSRLLSKGHAPFTDPRFPGAQYVVTPVCIADGKRLRGHDAHAHSLKSSIWYGLVCVKPGHESDRKLMAHEAAHLINWASPDIHGSGWRRVIRELGYPEEAERYKSRRRKAVLMTKPDGTTRDLLVPMRGSSVRDDDTLEVSSLLHDDLVRTGFVSELETRDDYVLTLKRRKRRSR